MFRPSMSFSRTRKLVCAALLAGASGACDTTVSPVQGGGSSTLPDPVRITGFDPPEGRIEVGPMRTFRVALSEPLAPETVGPAAVRMADAASGDPVAGTVTLGPGGQSLLFQPGAMPAGPGYCLSLDPGLRGASGGALEMPGGGSIPDCAAVYSTFASRPVLAGTVVAEARSSSAIEVSWDAAQDPDVPSSELVYEVFEAPASDPPTPDVPSLVSEPGLTGALLTGLVPGTSYNVAVRARDPVGNVSDLSPPVSATTLSSSDVTAPSFSGVASLIPSSPVSLRAAWSPATDDQNPPELIRYNAYVAVDAGGQDFGAPAATSAPGAAEMEIAGLQPDTAHHVVIRAVDTAGNEDANLVELAATTLISFSANVFPILTRTDMGGCSRATCHSGSNPDGMLDLTTYDGLMAGGVTVNPPTVKSGDGEGSYILWRTDRSNPNYRTNLTRMPSGGRALTSDQLGTIERWIDQGAIDN